MQKLKIRWALDVLWLSILILYVLLGVRDVPFHGDESTLIYTTRDYAYQFMDRDLSMVTYDGNSAIDPMDQNLRLLDGRVHKYLGGLFWHLAGYSVDDLNKPWLWGADWNYNLTNGHIPADDLLVTTRYASALLMAVGVIAMFGIGLQVDGRVTAYAASAFYALHPALLVNGRRSMMEGGLMGFSLLTVLAALYFIQVIKTAPQEKTRFYERPWFVAVLLGLAAGLTISSKHTGLLVIVVVFGALGLYVLVDGFRLRGLHLRDDLMRGIGWLFFAGVLALVVFYAFNPAWWGDPIGRAQTVATLRSTLLSDQSAIFGKYPTLLDQFGGFWRQTVQGAPMYYESSDWATFIGDQIARYDTSVWRGVTPGELVPIGTILLVVLIGAGVVRLFRQDGLYPAQRWLVGVWAAGLIVIVFVVTPLEWQRYYLPAILPLCLLSGLGVSYLWQQIQARRAARLAA